MAKTREQIEQENLRLKRQIEELSKGAIGQRDKLIHQPKMRIKDANKRIGSFTRKETQGLVSQANDLFLDLFNAAEEKERTQHKGVYDLALTRVKDYLENRIYASTGSYYQLDGIGIKIANPKTKADGTITYEGVDRTNDTITIQFIADAIVSHEVDPEFATPDPVAKVVWTMKISRWMIR